MGRAKTIPTLVFVICLPLASSERTLAVYPVGLEAIERFDLISALRHEVRTYQYSSHDPSGGNADRGHFLQVIGGEQVLLEVRGPGCICRMWFTGHDPNGYIRIYFDGSPSPLVEMRLSEFFSGAYAPFLSPLVGNDAVSSGGFYCYLPMPFREGCRITSTGGDHYYNITFQRFADADGVTTFTGQEDSTAARSLWDNAGTDPKPDPGDTTITNTVGLPAGSTTTIADIPSAGIIQQLEITIGGLGSDPSGPVTDDGRAFTGHCEFQVTVDPDNQGVKLKRRLDYGIGNQRANVFVDDVPAGQWSTPGGSTNTWLDSVFEIPDTLSAGKSSLTIRVEFVSSDLDWNEFYYRVYSVVGTNHLLTDELDVRDTNSEASHSYTIIGQTWEGARTYTYDSPGWATILSQLRLLARWDGAGEPAVDVPVGDFFGSGLGPYRVRGLPLGIDGERLYCYFPMPFAGSALLQITNAGMHVDNVTYTVRYTALESLPENTGRFHTKFLSETPTSTGRDYLILEETGAGHLVGVVQTMWGQDSSRGYLEGDERIYVDGGKTPSLYGTGTEDFYNGGWYFKRGPFTLPVHGNPAHEPGQHDATTCYRFLLSDLIPFTTSIRVGIEHGGTNDLTPDIYSVALYYKGPQPLATQTDELDVGSSSSESGHGYSANNGTWSGTSWFWTYEGDDDNVLVTDDGRRLAGGSEFTVAIDPANAGVLLRRRMDYSRPRQEARLYVDDALAGIWYDAGENDHHKFRDSEFVIPNSLTQAKSSITVRIENISAESDWTEYHYWVYALGGLPPGAATNPDPANLATRVGVNADLSWSAGHGAVSHDVYFGTADPPAFQGNKPETTFDPGTLENTTVYFWRIDEVNQVGTTTGDVWSFTTKNKPGDFDGDGDVDQEDFGKFQACLSGSGDPYGPGCEDADLDADNDADQSDFNVFRVCMSGPNLPADPGCADGF